MIERIKDRFGFGRICYEIGKPYDKDALYILENEEGLPEAFFQNKMSYLTKKNLSDMQAAEELVKPKIPMLVNTIENCYQTIAVYGDNVYAQEVYAYLLQNKNIRVIKVSEQELQYCGDRYELLLDEQVDMLLVFSLMAERLICDRQRQEVLTAYYKNMCRSSLKSTGNNLDITVNIIPKLLENDIQIIWVGLPDGTKIKNAKRIGRTIKFWDILRKKNENIFNRLRSYKFKTTYFLKESLSVVNSNQKGISENFFNGKYINFENGFRVTPGNDENVEQSIWLFGPCCVRGLGFDDDHTMSAKLQKKVGGRFNVINRGTVNTCLNYVMRMADYKSGDVAVFFAPGILPKERNEKISYIDMTEVLNEIPHLERHISDGYYHCDDVVIDHIVAALYAAIRKTAPETPAPLLFGSYYKKAPALEMYESNEYTQWLRSLEAFKKEGKNNGAIVMNANPFTYGHQYLAEYAAQKVDTLYIFVVQEDRSYFSYKDRLELVKKGTAHMENVVVLSSSKYIVSSSSLPGYFKKENMISGFKLDATQDLMAFAQAAQILDIKVRFAGEEPLDPFTNQYNRNMKNILPRYGVKFEVIARKEEAGGVVSASRVRKCIQEKRLDEIGHLVPPTTYEYLRRRFGSD